MLPSAQSYNFTTETVTYVSHEENDSVKLLRADMSVIATVYVPGHQCPYAHAPKHTKHIVETAEKVMAFNKSGKVIVERTLGETLAAVEVLPIKKDFKL